MRSKALLTCMNQESVACWAYSGSLHLPEMTFLWVCPKCLPAGPGSAQHGHWQASVLVPPSMKACVCFGVSSFVFAISVGVVMCVHAQAPVACWLFSLSLSVCMCVCRCVCTKVIHSSHLLSISCTEWELGIVF